MTTKRKLPKFMESKAKPAESKRACGHCGKSLPHEEQDEEGVECDICGHLFCGECTRLCEYCTTTCCVSCARPHAKEDCELLLKEVSEWVEQRGGSDP